MESTSTSPFDDYCRACTIQSKKSELLNLYKGSNVAEIFAKCTSIEASEMDGLPSHICKDCHRLLIGYSNFRLLCTSSDAYFRQKVLVKVENNELNTSGTTETEFHTEQNPSSEIQTKSYDEYFDQSQLNADSKTEILQYKQEESDGGCSVDNDDDNYEPPEGGSDGECSNDVPIKRKKKSKTKSKNDDSKEIFSCTLCPKRFFKKHRFDAHIRQHKGLKPCVCNICGKEFSKFSGLGTHMTTSHSDNPKEFRCDFPDCDRIYGMQQSLRHHKRKCHSDKPLVEKPPAYMCELCGKSFKSNNSLKKHTYTHTGLMPYKCTICPKKYATNHKLKEHMMRHEGVKNHICPFCGLKKTTSHELKVHINYHTREKLYPCKLCSSVFSSVGNMSRHVKIVHCGIKAFNCTYCERSFGKAETLKHHVMTHTGERPHGCSVCGKRFIQSIALQTHMKTHNKFT